MGSGVVTLTAEKAQNFGSNTQTITTLEIAEMMEVEHWQILRKLDGQEKDGKHIPGYVEILSDNEIVVSDYFIKSTYVTAQNKTMPCYEVTKLGCDFLANKFTGEKGILFTAKYVKRFNEMEKHLLSGKTTGQSPFLLCLQGVRFVADDLKVSEASKLLMYNGAFEEFGLPTSFLPKYEDNGSREQCPATELLKRNGCGMSAAKFNQLLLKYGYLEKRERTSSKGGTKKFKALTDKGLKYGVNLINEKNQREVQPYYYADTFTELFEAVTNI